MTFFALLWAKLSRWVIALGAVLAAIGSAWLYGRAKGKQAQQATDTARAAQDAIQAVQVAAQAQESRHDTDVAVSKFPDAPAQPVATADPATAAGQLRDDGWTRDG